MKYYKNQISVQFFFCVKIFDSVKDLLQDLYEQVDLYTDETYQAELAANAAVEAANDAAQSILAELDLQ